MQYSIRKVYPFDSAARQEVMALLHGEGITADRNLDYTCALYHPDGRMAATGSYYKNTLRCLAVSKAFQGEGLMNLVVSHLRDELASRGVFHLFMYTKYTSARFFQDLGFFPIAEVDRAVVFMENSAIAFHQYLEEIKKGRKSGKAVGAVVMNANPFTLGHQYLAETASKACDTLHLFVVREDISDFPYAVRDRLIREGTAHLPNIVYHHTGDYLVSSATFPSYFIRDTEEVTRAHARVDAAVFARIADSLHITTRFVGDEPFSFATNLYNLTMQECLPDYGISLQIIPRKTDGSTPISATRVRKSLVNRDVDSLAQLLPATTLDYLMGTEGTALLETIRDRMAAGEKA